MNGRLHLGHTFSLSKCEVSRNSFIIGERNKLFYKAGSMGKCAALFQESRSLKLSLLTNCNAFEIQMVFSMFNE